MDPITLSFCAVVCSCLSVTAPKFLGVPILLGNGVSVGIIAAMTLPYIKDIMHAS
ncbi:hypothetical protein [Octadecabacter antarcticus]|uniref:hypothetical protein n=1 Tax=Octadecabacter antarcticus TaxID=1217908 RepID=UPI00018070F7|nr:hypothetical protein [Octadecabacter antarcticus]